MICFWGFGDLTSGGMQSIILMVAQYANKKDEKIKIFSLKESFLHRELLARRIQADFYDINDDKDKIKCNLSENDVIIITGISQFPNELLKYNPKVLYWMVYLYSFKEKNSIFNLHINPLTKRIVRNLIKNNSLVFMDGYCAEEVSMKKIESKILPIPYTFNKNSKTRRTPRDLRTINCTYIGRGVLWKVIPVRKVILDLEKLQRKIDFHIITDNQDSFRILLGQIQNIYVRLHFHNQLINCELETFLLKYSDLHFGMGTSSIEGAALRIPTIILDTSFKEFPDNYLYKWIFESDYSSLGRFIRKDMAFTGRTMNEIIDQACISQSANIKIGSSCYDYVLKNHNIKKIYNQILHHAEKTSMRYQSLFKGFLVNKIYYTKILFYIEEYIYKRSKQWVKKRLKK